MARASLLIGAFTTMPLKLINGSDSEVCIGAWAKGRSPSASLNSRLLKTMARNVLACKTSANYKVFTKDNPADDPTRDAVLRAPRVAPPWLGGLLDPEPSAAYRRGNFIRFR